MSITLIVPEDYDKPMNIYTPAGQKVVFLNKNGYEADRAFVAKQLTAAEYTVKRIEISQSSSRVFFEEIESEFGYNTVMFRNVSTDFEPFDWTAHLNRQLRQIYLDSLEQLKQKAGNV